MVTPLDEFSVVVRSHDDPALTQQILVNWLLNACAFFLKYYSVLYLFTFCTMALRRSPPARNLREGVLQCTCIKKRKIIQTQALWRFEDCRLLL